MVSTVPLSVHYATSMDEEHPPSNIVDSDDTTFWTSTGLFPQEVVLAFKEPAQITRVTITSGKLRNIVVYGATDKELSDWMEIDSYHLPANPVKQQEMHQLTLHATYYGIKLFIDQAWGPFVAIYGVRVEGPPVRDLD